MTSPIVTLSTVKSTAEDDYCDEIHRNQKRENHKKKGGDEVVAMVPPRIILQQVEEVEDELARVNRKTLNLDQNLEKNYRSKKGKAGTSDSSPLTKAFDAN